jgi:2-hydroxycyclohexanecarboxyl-CoA dehydrogenase
MGRLEGQIALITGGGAGIGAAAALLFCREGAAVTLVDADGEAIARTKDRIQQEVRGARIEGFQADIVDEARAEQAVEHCARAFGGLTILVNNAAMRRPGSIADTGREDWQAILNVNVIGVANYCRAALPRLRAAGHSAIVNVSSAHALIGRKNMGLYDTTKAGQLALTRTLAFEEAANGVRVNAVCPGSTFTDFHVNKALAAGKDVEQLKTERSHNSLLGRWGLPHEIAWPILWLASSEASFITGATLMADGGLSIM